MMADRKLNVIACSRIPRETVLANAVRFAGLIARLRSVNANARARAMIAFKK